MVGAMAEPSGRESALRPVSRLRLYKQLVERLLAYVSDEGLGAGKRLPTERDLALAARRQPRVCGTGRRVAWEVQGILSVRQGDGIYLVRQADPAESIQELMKRRQRLPEILEAREAIEVEIASLAAQRRTEEDMDAIDAALDKMAAEVAAGEHGYDGDMTFHAAVTSAARRHITLVADVALLTVESEHGANTEPETGGGTDLPLANSLPDRLTSGVVVA